MALAGASAEARIASSASRAPATRAESSCPVAVTVKTFSRLRSTRTLAILPHPTGRDYPRGETASFRRLDVHQAAPDSLLPRATPRPHRRGAALPYPCGSKRARREAARTNTPLAFTCQRKRTRRRPGFQVHAAGHRRRQAAQVVQTGTRPQSHRSPVLRTDPSRGPPAHPAACTYIRRGAPASNNHVRTRGGSLTQWSLRIANRGGRGSWGFRLRPRRVRRAGPMHAATGCSSPCRAQLIARVHRASHAAGRRVGRASGRRCVDRGPVDVRLGGAIRASDLHGQR
jgi:hypothetical protein